MLSCNEIDALTHCKARLSAIIHVRKSFFKKIIIYVTNHVPLRYISRKFSQ